jgi:dipeptidyl aminopeptidase/acylaminoacyl peptidase
MYSMVSSDVPQLLSLELGADLWDDPGRWLKYDPCQFTANWQTPMLIIHSDNDFRCPITEGLAAFHVCQMRGIESRFLNFPDENHFVLKRENLLQWFRTMLGWCNKFAGVKDGVRLGEPITRPRPRQAGRTPSR